MPNLTVLGLYIPPDHSSTGLCDRVFSYLLASRLRELSFGRQDHGSTDLDNYSFAEFLRKFPSLSDLTQLTVMAVKASSVISILQRIRHLRTLKIGGVSDDLPVPSCWG